MTFLAALPLALIVTVPAVAGPAAENADHQDLAALHAPTPSEVAQWQESCRQLISTYGDPSQGPPTVEIAEYCLTTASIDPAAFEQQSVSYYADDHGVDQQVARAQLAWQNKFSTITGLIRIQAGDRLGTAHTVFEPAMGIVVTLTPGPRLPSVEHLAEESGRLVSLTYDATASMRSLAEWVDQHGRALKEEYPEIGFITADEQSASVLVAIQASAERAAGIESAVRQFGARDGIVFQFSSSELPAGSYEHNMGGRNLQPGCTSGFPVVDLIGQKFLTTSGHCTPPTAWKQFTNPALTYAVQTCSGCSIVSGSYDFQYFRMLAGNPVQPKFFGPGTTLASAVPLTGMEYRNYMMSDYVCHRGQTSGFSCGTVDNIYANWGNVSTWVSYFGPSALSMGGDSGGPTFRYASGVAYGSHTGSLVSGGKNVELVFMPIECIGYFDLSLYYS